MIRTGLFTVAALGALAISGCSGVAEEPATASSIPSPSATKSAAPSAAPVSTPTPTPSATTNDTEVVASGLPTECEGTEGTQDTDGDAIAVAAASAELPDGLVLMGTQVITSIDENGMFEAVARTCSAPLSEDEMYGVANAIALAIYEDPAGDSLQSLRVTSWDPDGAGSISEGVKVRTEDFQIYLWDTQISAGSNWELAGRDY